MLLLVLNLPFTVVLAAVTIRHRAPDRVMLAGAACCTAGIALFLVVAQRHGGAGTASPGGALPLATALAAVVTGCQAAASWAPRLARPLWLALACGADFGVRAFLLTVIPGTLPFGVRRPAGVHHHRSAVPARNHHRHTAGPGRRGAALAVMIGGIITLARRAQL